MPIKPEEVNIPDSVLEYYDSMQEDFRKQIMRRALNLCVLSENDTMSDRELERAHDYYCSDYAV